MNCGARSISIPCLGRLDGFKVIVPVDESSSARKRIQEEYTAWISHAPGGIGPMGRTRSKLIKSEDFSAIRSQFEAVRNATSLEGQYYEARKL